ncbi:PREDICTED: actin-binding protein IPP-like [Priapulus caudatus]|uniref:Actin-binding protein IPP-like n=1 Tax=Priapulus caudatus TaxID=37621 RepID=A0ABM1EBV8_PRICU|nr:PREDICTED: actin-binding protein IPP-like [Priapulus caudatus]
MVKNLDSSNCIGVYLFADAHYCNSLKRDAEAFIFSHFLDVLGEEEFFSLSHEDLGELLLSEKLRIDNEFQVLKAAIDWISHDLQTRRRHIFSLVKCIRLPIISQQQLERYVEGLKDLGLKIGLRKILQDYKSDFSLARDARMGKINVINWQPRQCAKKNIYVIGGYSRLQDAKWSDNITLGNMEMFDSFKQTWTLLPPLRYARSGIGVAALAGRIYAVGGESNSLIHDSAEVYDPDERCWKPIPSLTSPRYPY